MGQVDSKIIGAFLIGFAIVAGAYVINNINSPTPEIIHANNVATVSEAPPRVFIDVKDSNNDGLEDWQEQFLTPEPIYINRNSNKEYKEPDTLTGKIGIALFQNKLISKMNNGSVLRSEEQMITDVVDTMAEYGKDKIYTIRDIKVTNDFSSATIRNYGNSLALTILDSGTDTKIRSTFDILRDIAINKTVSEDDLDDLEAVKDVFYNTYKGFLDITVPAKFTKTHLDLINVNYAMYKDIEGLTKANSDPAVSLMRLKRYADDLDGLKIALENVYLTLEPYAQYFSTEDPVVIFIRFSPDFKNNI